MQYLRTRKQLKFDIKTNNGECKKMNIDDLTYGQVKELRHVFGGTADAANHDILNPEIRIVVLQRGWVIVGRFTRKGEYIHITDANVIRSWGTSKGLGELAVSGPLSETKLDPIPDIEAHALTIVLTSKCVGEKWESKLR